MKIVSVSMVLNRCDRLSHIRVREGFSSLVTNEMIYTSSTSFI